MASCEILSAPQSPAKKQRCDEGTPEPQYSFPSSSKEEETQDPDPRSKIEWYTYDEDVEDDSDGTHEMTDKEYQEYERQIEESDGFDVMHFPRSFGLGKMMPIFHMDEHGACLKSHSELALREYNEREKTNLEFVKVVKANGLPVSGTMYYITFDVKDQDAVDGRTKEFQACVWDGISKTTVEFCRPKPTKVIEDCTKAICS